MPGRLKFLSQGSFLGARETGWQLTGMDYYDLTGLSIAIATPSLTVCLVSVPNVQPIAAPMGSQDSFYGSALGVANTHQAAGSLVVPQAGQIPWLGVFSNPILFSRSNADAAVTYGAASNVSVRLLLVSASTSSTASVSNFLNAAFGLSTIVNVQTAISLGTIPAARQFIAPNGIQVANSVLIYPGDQILAQFTNSSGGAITVANGNTLAIGYDLY